MNILQRWVIRPSEKRREIYLALGSFLLILAVIAFAGSDFSFDEALKPQLKKLAFGLLTVGGLLWMRGSLKPAGQD